MELTMRPKIRRQAGRFIGAALIGTGVGVVYGSLKGYALQAPLSVGGMIGAIHGATIAGGIGFMEIFMAPTRLGRRIETLPMMTVVLVKGSLVVAVVGGGGRPFR
jgi:hypothetical protein